MNKHPIAIEFTDEAEEAMKIWFGKNEQCDYVSAPKLMIIEIKMAYRFEKHDVVMVMGLVK